MTEQRIIIEIDENGKIKAKTSEIKGEICLDELQELLEDIAVLDNVKKTDEFYQKKEIRTSNKISLKKEK